MRRALKGWLSNGRPGTRPNCATPGTGQSAWNRRGESTPWSEGTQETARRGCQRRDALLARYRRAAFRATRLPLFGLRHQSQRGESVEPEKRRLGRRRASRRGAGRFAGVSCGIASEWEWMGQRRLRARQIEWSGELARSIVEPPASYLGSRLQGKVFDSWEIIRSRCAYFP